MSYSLADAATSQVRSFSGRPADRSTLMEMWQGLSAAVVDRVASDWDRTNRLYATKRREHYFSAEFLMGRALLNNLSNLGLTNEAEKIVNSFGQTLSDVLEQEPDAALGNGGLGRLAASTHAPHWTTR